MSLLVVYETKSDELFQLDILLLKVVDSPSLSPSALPLYEFGLLADIDG